MSENNTDNVMEAKLESYKEHLQSLSAELLLSEFYDRIKYIPEEYYINPQWFDNQTMWIETLLDVYAVYLFDKDIDADWTKKA